MLDWLEITRMQAEERCRALPLPSSQDENFRFLSFSYLDRSSQPSVVSEQAPAELVARDGEEGSLLVLNGATATLHGEPIGLTFTDMQTMARLDGPLVRARLQNEDLFPKDKFSQLTISRWRNGAYVHIPAGEKPALPLRFVSLVTAPEQHSRHLIELEAGAEAVVIQESWSDSQEHFWGEFTEVRLGKNSKLHWVTMQQLGSHTEAMLRQKITLAEGAELLITPLHLGAGVVQMRQEVRIVGDRAALESSGAARGDGNQQFDFWLDVQHLGAKSASKMDFWFVMADQARAVFNGQLLVEKDVPDCEASQRSRSLLLGTKATVHAIPKLIIKTDAVKCAHGASVSSVNFEQLHYLQSRGISREEAEHMIVRGFTEPVVERLPTEGLRARAEAGLSNKRGGLLV